jgi:hypothetical protein
MLEPFISKFRRFLNVVLFVFWLISPASEFYVPKCLHIQGDQKVSVHLMITVQKTLKNILNSFNHLP